MTGARQLPLPFLPRETYTAVDFVAAPSNAAARTWLARPNEWPFCRLVLHGPAGSGKTHLLHLWQARQGGVIWPGQALRGVPGLPADGPVAVDDADLADEEALFHLINAAFAARRPLVLAAREAPSRWGTRLADLASRLRASMAVGIGPAEDALLRPLLAKLLAERQLDVPDRLQAWLLTRLARQPAALGEAVARLDRAALARGRGVTRALMTAILAEMSEAADQPGEEFLMQPSPPVPVLL